MNTTPATLTDAQKTDLRDQLAKWGWVFCPCCGWADITVTKAGKIRKHGRAQTGNDGLGCAGSGASIL